MLKARKEFYGHVFKRGGVSILLDENTKQQSLRYILQRCKGLYVEEVKADEVNVDKKVEYSKKEDNMDDSNSLEKAEAEVNNYTKEDVVKEQPKTKKKVNVKNKNKSKK